ncbi:MAG: hypothetical protein CM15mV11_2900 [Caudoviricetes sp.]|nr:MAG: hypothetical protein CM15mV11_2900 [Caudoviricetes sp.]
MFLYLVIIIVQQMVGSMLDTFIRDVCSRSNGGEETINIRVAKNNTQPPAVYMIHTMVVQ